MHTLASMMTHKTCWLTILQVALGAVLALSACGGMGASTPAATVTAQPSEPAAMEIVTLTLAPSPTLTSLATPSFTPTVTPSPAATSTPQPTDTPVPPPTNTEIPAPTATETPPPTSELAYWSGIPIMPQAYGGEQKANAYLYYVPATVQQVRDFYDSELTRLGWQPHGATEATHAPGCWTMGYQKDGKNLGILACPAGDAARVMIVPPV